MMTAIIICLLAGAVLGQRCKVLILLPATTLAILAATGAGIARGEHVWSILLSVVAVMVALQMGYLLGTGIRSALAGARASRMFRGPVATPAPVVVRRRAAH